MVLTILDLFVSLALRRDDEQRQDSAKSDERRSQQREHPRHVRHRADVLGQVEVEELHREGLVE